MGVHNKRVENCSKIIERVFEIDKLVELIKAPLKLKAGLTKETEYIEGRTQLLSISRNDPKNAKYVLVIGPLWLLTW